MRDILKPEEYFVRCIEEEKARIDKFADILASLDNSNLEGQRRGKIYLSTYYRNLLKLSYSVGEQIASIVNIYINLLQYYADVRTADDSMYDIIDIFAIGVLLNNYKEQFIEFLEIIFEKFNSSDGMIKMFMDYLSGKTFQENASAFEYFNELLTSEDKEKVLYNALNSWYSSHQGVYWYDSHRLKTDTYCGYWCFEIAALAKIYKVDDARLRESQYYPSDLADYEYNEAGYI